MDISKLPKIRDEERESEFGYVHGVSGPGLPPQVLPALCIYNKRELSTFAFVDICEKCKLTKQEKSLRKHVD